MLEPSTTANWPINYTSVFAWRQMQLIRIRQSAALIYGAREYYRTHPVQFINHWCDTYDPRNAGSSLPIRLPLILFPKQQELVEFLWACLNAEVGGLVEKSRDMGATWVCAAFSVWLWLFVPGSAVGWGSRKEQLVDRLGDMDSIFEKMRMLVKGLPDVFLPLGFNESKNIAYMRFINPETGSSITGEGGDNIGRGGRKSIYFKDESAHYERPEKIEAALADNTRVPIDISSVNGTGNVFHRKREAGAEWGGKVVPGKIQVFVMDWRDHPAKDQAWYDDRKARAIEEGLQHILAQEVDRDYASAVQGVIIAREWVQAAVDAHKKLGIEETGEWCSALDVADDGPDTNAQATRKGIVLKDLEEWGSRDVAQTARRAVATAAKYKKVALQYDCIGVGAGVKAEANNLKDDNRMPHGIKFIPWNAGAGVLNPDKRVIPKDKESPLNKDFYTNLKAQGWWELRGRFYRTFRAVTEGAEYDPDTLISLDGSLKNLRKLEKELCQVTASKGAKLKLVVDKTPEGTRSPNLADAVMMAYWPVKSGYDLEKMING